MSDSPPVKTGEIQKKRYFLFSNYGCLIIALLFVAGAFALLYPAVQATREAARRMCCVPKQLGLAFHIYHDHYINKSFPPAFTVDADGKPLHSWRVLLLPYIEQQQLYEEICLDEPWDSPHNSQFHDKMPRAFHCPSRSAEEIAKGLMPFQMIIGPDTISNGPNNTTFSDIVKNKGDTLLFVEASVPVPWMKPEDLPQSMLKNGVVSSVPRRGQSVTPGIGSPHYYQQRFFEKKITGANVAMVDGSCHFFTAEMTPEELLEKSRVCASE